MFDFDIELTPLKAEIEDIFSKMNVDEDCGVPYALDVWKKFLA